MLVCSRGEYEGLVIGVRTHYSAFLSGLDANVKKMEEYLGTIYEYAKFLLEVGSQK